MQLISDVVRDIKAKVDLVDKRKGYLSSELQNGDGITFEITGTTDKKLKISADEEFFNDLYWRLDCSNSPSSGTWTHLGNFYVGSQNFLITKFGSYEEFINSNSKNWTIHGVQILNYSENATNVYAGAIKGYLYVSWQMNKTLYPSCDFYGVMGHIYHQGEGYIGSLRGVCGLVENRGSKIGQYVVKDCFGVYGEVANYTDNSNLDFTCGVFGRVITNSIALINEAIGGRFVIENQATATINTAYGVKSEIIGNCNEAYLLHASFKNSEFTADNQYKIGLFIDEIPELGEYNNCYRFSIVAINGNINLSNRLFINEDNVFLIENSIIIAPNPTGSTATIFYEIPQSIGGLSILVYSNSITPYISGARARGTFENPTAVQFGDNLLAIGASGTDENGMTDPAAIIFFRASENWTSTKHGVDIFFISTQKGTTNSIIPLYISSENKVKISNAYWLPSSDGSNGQALKTDGHGNCYWDNVGNINGSGQSNYLAIWSGSNSITYNQMFAVSSYGLELVNGNLRISNSQNNNISNSITFLKNRNNNIVDDGDESGTISFQAMLEENLYYTIGKISCHIWDVQYGKGGLSFWGLNGESLIEIFYLSANECIFNSNTYLKINGTLSIEENAVLDCTAGILQIPIYNQDTEPDIANNSIAFWRDSTNGKYYLIVDWLGTQKKIELI